MYEIDFSLTAEKQLLKLDKNAQRRIIATLERVRIRPHSYVKKLVACTYFRLRVGDYRVILDIKKSKLIIFVVETGHRKSIYAKF